MTTTAPDHGAAAARGAPAGTARLARAGSFLEGVAAQDFGQLADALAADVRCRALLPGGLREWTGALVIADRFARWFGDTEAFEAVDAGVEEVAGRLRLYWRLRLRADRLGDGWFTVEQQAYADTAEDCRIAQFDLLCTGYLPEVSDD